MGLGSIVYVLCKLEGQLHQKETKVPCELLADCSYSDLAICAMFIRDNVGAPPDEAGADGLSWMASKRVEISKETKKRFVNILLRVARAHEGISREERAFIRQFWRELQRM